MVFQHFSLFETLTVTENVWLGLAETSKAVVTRGIREQSARYGLGNGCGRVQASGKLPRAGEPPPMIPRH